MAQLGNRRNQNEQCKRRDCVCRIRETRRRFASGDCRDAAWPERGDSSGCGGGFTRNGNVVRAATKHRSRTNTARMFGCVHCGGSCLTETETQQLISTNAICTRIESAMRQGPGSALTWPCRRLGGLPWLSGRRPIPLFAGPLGIHFQPIGCNSSQYNSRITDNADDATCDTPDRLLVLFCVRHREWNHADK